MSEHIEEMRTTIPIPDYYTAGGKKPSFIREEEFISSKAGQFTSETTYTYHRNGMVTAKRIVKFETVTIPTTDLLTGKDEGRKFWTRETYLLRELPEFNIVLSEEVEELENTW